MDIRRLRYLCVVAEEEHLTRAAERLGIRPSSLSEQILALERALNATLFTRTQAGMKPTAAAQALLPHARRVLEAADLGVRAVRDSVDRQERPLTVGVTPGAPPSAVLALHTAGDVEPRDLAAARQVELLRRGALDGGLIALPEDLDGLRAAVVSETPLGVLVADDHPLAGVNEVSWHDLTGQDLLLYDRDLAPGYHDALLAWCADAGWRPGFVRSGPPRRSFFVAALRHDHTVLALRPRWDAADGLRWLPMAADPATVRHALVWNPAHKSSARTEVLVSRLSSPDV